jgi:hypothetical protein
MGPGCNEVRLNTFCHRKSQAEREPKETGMTDGKQKRPTARETAGEGAAPRKRKEGPAGAEEHANPKRGDERDDARLIERRRDARNPEGL